MNSNLSNPTLRKKRSRGEIEIKNEMTIDVLLTLITTIHKSGEGEKCICTYLPTSGEKNVFTESEIVPNFEVKFNSEAQIKFSEIVQRLKQLGYPLTGAMFSVYSQAADEYVCFGSDPVDQNTFIDVDQLPHNFLKIRCVCHIDEKLLNKEKGKGTISRGNSMDLRKCKRTKERKIGFIIEKVNLWRKYYNGFKNENGTFIKHTLDDSAKIIGISKKSLDDYLLQLRLGRKYGFDFNMNRNSKVGLLRSFVKQHREKQNNCPQTIMDIKQDK